MRVNLQRLSELGPVTRGTYRIVYSSSGSSTSAGKPQNHQQRLKNPIGYPIGTPVGPSSGHLTSVDSLEM